MGVLLFGIGPNCIRYQTWNPEARWCGHSAMYLYAVVIVLLLTESGTKRL